MARNPPISPMRFAVSTAFISGQLPRGKDGKVTAGNVQDHIPRAQQLSRLWLRLMPWLRLKPLPIRIANKAFASGEMKQG